MKAPNILIVEDNPVSRKILKISLETENYAVVEASTGAAALQEAEKHNYDLIIQDMLLPDMDGYTLNQKLRALPNVQKIPIFALSGFLSPLSEQVKKTGFTTFLLKPIEPSYLLDVVKAHLPSTHPSQAPCGQGKHILIADDNPIQLKLLNMQLKNLGFEVTTALDGVIALQKAKSAHFDAIISDILMPNLDGFGLCLELKRDPILSSIPVMLLTSHYLEDDDLALAKKVGANCYLTRTPDSDKLVSKLLKILNSKLFVASLPLFEMTEDIKKELTVRSIHQLEQQVLDNAKLAQRCAMLMSQLSLISGIANALTTSSSKSLDLALKEVIYLCLDATGISKGALYIKDANNNFVLSQQIGYSEEQKGIVESFFGISTLIPRVVEKNEPFIVPSEQLTGQSAEDFLNAAAVKSALMAPMFSGTECLGIFFMGSNLRNLSSEHVREFVRALGIQFGQSIALARAFDKLGSSEKRYRQLVEISPDAIFIEQAGKFVYANSSALKLLGANSSEELFNHSFYDFFPTDYQNIIKEYTEQNKNQASRALSDGKIINLKGAMLDVEVVVSSLLYQERAANYMIMRDITERKRSMLHLEIQYAIAWILAESATLFIATGRFLKIICKRLQWDCGAIWAVNKEEQVLRCTRFWQTSEIQNHAFKNASQNITIQHGTGILGRTWETRKAVWRSDILHDESFARKTSIAEIGLNTAVAFPIIYENKVLGMIEFFSKSILQPDKNLLLWFESIGNQFGLYLMRKHAEKQMLYLAEHDVLTGLSNRSLLEQYLNTALTVAKESKQRLAILFLDLDHFKYVNDSMGHQSGDLLLKEISERFRQCLRPEDTISRLGGDEFVIIIPNIRQNAEITEIIDRLQQQLSTQILVKDKEFFMTASIGISLYPEDGDEVQTLIKGADIAMYAAKEKGRNTYQFCTPEMTVKAENRGVMQNNLRHALENNEFLLYYQPKIDVATRKISGMEALIRWQRPDAVLAPGSFISAAEESKLIIPIGEWVLKTACLQNKAWQDAGLPTITMSINLSIQNLTKQLLLETEKLLEETKLNPNSLEVELTESVLMENVKNNIQILRSLKAMGLKISIDDFGTGYSSLSYLKRFPIDTLKIDQSFVRDIATDPDDAKIVTAIIAMSHSLGFKVIAEGVETLAQLRFLCENGCDEIQGYYFSRPMPVEKATDFIRNAKIEWNFD